MSPREYLGHYIEGDRAVVITSDGHTHVGTVEPESGRIFLFDRDGFPDIVLRNNAGEIPSDITSIERIGLFDPRFEVIA